MTAGAKLSPPAREQLRAAGVSQAAWIREYGDGRRWTGDTCGCPDDRCVGYHHDEHEDCGCLPALLSQMPGAVPPPWGW